MSDYQAFPSNGPEPVHRPPAAPTRPRSVELALRLVWASVALALLSTLVQALLLDELVDQALEQAGEAGTELTEGMARAAALGGLAFGLVIGVALVVLLAVFIGRGAGWARITYTVVAGLGLLFGLLGLAGAASTPLPLLLLNLLGLALTVATLFFLWRPDANAWFATVKQLRA